jgi:hypothetical protein
MVHGSLRARQTTPVDWRPQTSAVNATSNMVTEQDLQMRFPKLLARMFGLKLDVYTANLRETMRRYSVILALPPKTEISSSFLLHPEESGNLDVVEVKPQVREGQIKEYRQHRRWNTDPMR